MGIQAEVARGIKERTGGVCSVTHLGTNSPAMLLSERSDGCYQVMDGLGRQRRQRFTGTVPL